MSILIRDPNLKRADGNPKCFGNYQEGHYTCDHACFKPLMCKVETDDEEPRREGKQFRGLDGRPTCFAKLYDSLSEECGNCGHVRECSEIFETNVTHTTRSSTAIKSEGLKVFNQPPNPYANYGYRSSTPSYYQPPIQQPNPHIQSYPVDEKLNAYMRAKYGVPLQVDPTIPGQFEGEAWYERFFKEVLKYAGYYSLQLLSHVLMNTRWAPNTEEE